MVSSFRNNFKRRKALEFPAIFSWQWVKTCFFECWLRWYKNFSIKIILKSTCPNLKFRNDLCNFSALEHLYGLKLSVKALFLISNTMTSKSLSYSKILGNLGIISESHHYDVSAFFYLLYTDNMIWWCTKINHFCAPSKSGVSIGTKLSRTIIVDYDL